MSIEKVQRKLSVAQLHFQATATGTALVDPANASGGHETVTATFTLTGAEVGDLILMFMPAALEDDLVLKGARVTSANTVTVYLYAGATVNGAERTWNYIWFKQV